MHDSNGIVTISSRFSFDETVDRIRHTLSERSIKLFVTVDHSGEAASVELKMPPTKLLIFGNPKAGTPVMVAAPSSALDLPLKLLVAEDSEGRVTISYNSTDYLQKRHGFPQEFVSNLAVIEKLAANAGG